MSKYLKKIVEHYCSICNGMTDMEIASHNDELDIYWLRCKVCHGATMIKNKNLEKLAIRKANDTLINDHQVTDQVKEYDPAKTYEAGQLLYHPAFDDQGVVTELKSGSGDFDKIVVKFDHIGEKMLIHGAS